MIEALPIQFIYEPDFVPNFFKAGKLVDTQTEEFMLEYVSLIDKQWTTGIGSRIAISTNKFFYTEPASCRVLRSRIELPDSTHIEAVSNPLSIYATPSDSRWEYLPFHARVVHELFHRQRFHIWRGDWESVEDSIARDLRPKIDLFAEENRGLLEELVVRKFTDESLRETFSPEFADWFANRESSLDQLIEINKNLPS